MEHELDPTDQGILRLLQEDARLSHKEIAAKLHKTITPIHSRIRRLQEEGYIKRYTAIVDPKKIGRNLIAYTQVELKEHSQKILTTFMEEAVKLPEVMECYHMTGNFDFLLRVAVKDMNEYNTLLMEKLSNLPYIGTMESLFVMSEAKHETAYVIGSKKKE